MKQIPILCLVAAMGVAQVADAAGNTPINTPARAARSALYALELPNTISQRVNDDDYGARNIIEKGFDLLEAATTVEALLASPRGIVVPCPSGGTLTTRMSRSVPRLVTFDWADCKQTDLVGQVYSQTGPAEVVMTEASFRPKTLYSLRLGNGARDHVESHPRMPNVAYGEFVVRRNQRFTGVIQQREFDWQDVPGGTYELTGFVERTLMLPDRNAGQPPSTELYPYVTYTYADHALLSRERTSGYDANQVWSYHEDIVFAWGLLGSRNDVPARPNKPATSTTDEYRGFGLRAQNLLGGPPGRSRQHRRIRRQAAGASLRFEGPGLHVAGSFHVSHGSSDDHAPGDVDRLRLRRGCDRGKRLDTTRIHRAAIAGREHFQCEVAARHHRPGSLADEVRRRPVRRRTGACRGRLQVKTV
jgi:hypothetical protein